MQRRNAQMFTIEHEIAVDFIGQHPQVVRERQLRDPFEVGTRHHDPGRIARRGKKDRLGTRRNGGFEPVAVQMKAARRIDRHRNQCGA